MRSKVALRVCLSCSLLGQFGLVLLLSPFLFLPPLFRPALLHLGVLPLLLLVLLLPLFGLFLGLLFRCGCHGGCGVCGLPCGCAWVVDGAVVVGANGEGGAYALAVDDDGGFSGGAG